MAILELPREELLAGLCYIRRELLAVDQLLGQYLLLAGQYQQKAIAASRNDFPGAAAEQLYREAPAITGPEKLNLMTFGLPAVLTLFFTFIEVIKLIFMGSFAVWNCIPPIACLGILIWDRKGTSQLRKPALAVLGLYAIWEAWAILNGGLNLFLGIVLILSAVAAVLVMLGFNHAAQKRRDRETDIYNRTVAAEKQRGDEEYRQHVAEVEAHNRQVRVHNRNIDIRRFESWEKAETIMDQVKANTEAWFPPDYYSLAAVEFFINALRNYKAETIKELVLLFDDHMYKEKMFSSQKKLLEYQKSIYQVGQEQLQMQRDQLISSLRSEVRQIKSLKNQQEISSLLQASNMLQLMNGMRQSMENEDLKATIRDSTQDITRRMY